MLARSHQLQSIFRLLKPFLHVQIWCQSVAVFQNHGVCPSEAKGADSVTTSLNMAHMGKFLALNDL